jgi:hypothetical protein
METQTSSVLLRTRLNNHLKSLPQLPLLGLATIFLWPAQGLAGKLWGGTFEEVQCRMNDRPLAGYRVLIIEDEVMQADVPRLNKPVLAADLRDAILLVTRPIAPLLVDIAPLSAAPHALNR